LDYLPGNGSVVGGELPVSGVRPTYVQRYLIRPSLVVCLLLAFFTIPLAQAANAPPVESNEIDRLTADVLQQLAAGELAKSLVTRFPNFALGQLLYGELQAIAARQPIRISHQYSFSPQLMALLLEAKTRLAHVNDALTIQAHHREHLPASVIQAGSNVDHVIVVDLQQLQLYLFDTRGPRPQLMTQHYVAGGSAGFGKLIEGDNKTPLGSYRITSWRDDDSLPPLYGSGALTLDYPNPLDISLGRTGSGIWLHGVPRDQQSRPPRSSEGCVTMSNDYLEYLHQTININRARVVLGTGIEWQSIEAQTATSNSMLTLFEKYRSAWASGDAAQIAALYDPDALPSALTDIELANASGLNKVSLNSPSTFSNKFDMLSTIDPDSIAIFRHPDLAAHASSGTAATGNDYIEMRFATEPNGHDSRLFWELDQTSGTWRIVASSHLNLL